jgi:hypothetical protein
LELRAAGQNPPKRQFPTPPQGADPLPAAPGGARTRTTDEAVLREHEKAFRDCLTALSGRVNQLNQEVAALHSADVFSVTIYKQSGEIEKLAKQLKSLAKG